MLLEKMKKLGLAVLIAVLVTACSDGEIRLEQVETSLDPGAPSIIMFSADKDEITVGSSVGLSWEVVNADVVQISGLSLDGEFEYLSDEITELADKLTVSSIPSTTEFVITAIKYVAGGEDSGDGTEETPLVSSMKISINRAEGEEESSEETEDVGSGTLTDVASVLVTVVGGGGGVDDPNALDVDITAYPALIHLGETSLIHWWVSPTEDVEVQVYGSDGVPIVPIECPTMEELSRQVSDEDEVEETPEDETDEVDEEDDSGEEIPDDADEDDDVDDPDIVPSAFPTEACAIVKPEADTVYTIEARKVGGTRSYSMSTPVKVDDGRIGDGLEIVTFSFDNQSGQVLVEGEYPVEGKLHWQVLPAGAKITVTSSSTESVSCDPVLPTDADSTGEQESGLCTVTADVEMTLTAKYGDLEDSRKLVFTQMVVPVVALKVEMPEWAFAGEQITVKVDKEQNVNAGLLESIIIGGQSFEPTFPIEEVVTAPSDGMIEVKLFYTDGREQNLSRRTIVLAFNTLKEAGADETSFTSIAIVPDPLMNIIGVKQSSAYGGRVVVNGKVHNLDISETYASAYGALLNNAEALFKKVGDYPTIVATFDANIMYAGTTGGLFKSKDGGKSWKLIMVTPPIYVASNGVYPTCHKKNMNGLTEGVYGAITQICDILPIDQDVVAFATSTGVLGATKDNFYGIVTGTDVSADSTAYKTFGHVANALASDGTRLYAATARGIYISSDNAGRKWVGEKGELGYIYDVAVSGDKVFAVADDGLYSSEIGDSPEWTKIKEEKVNSIAVDSSDSSIIITAADDGLSISRDGGTNWTAISVGGEDEAIKFNNVTFAKQVLEDGTEEIVFGAASDTFVLGANRSIALSDVETQETAENDTEETAEEDSES